MHNEVSDYHAKCHQVFDKVNKDLQASDFKITIFVTACQALKPQHVTLTEKHNYKQECILEKIKHIAGIPMLLNMLRSPESYVLDKFMLETLHWLMVVRCDPKIVTVPSTAHNEILGLVSEQHTNKDLIPHYIFKIEYCPTTKYAQDWKVKQAQYDVKYGYNATHLKDCFTKLFSGTQVIAGNKPLILNSNLKETYHQVPFSQSWCRSILGYSLKVLMLIEFIDHPNLGCVNFRKSKLFRNSSSYNLGLRGKKFMVGDASLARYAYILVYKNSKDKEQSTVSLYFLQFAVMLITLFAATFSAIVWICLNKV